MVARDDDYRDAKHQPAAPADLAAHPPADERCLRVRELLRDFVDGELSVEVRADVESHVHGCRACGLALSRSESEWMQITSALGEVEVVGLSDDFTASVMRKVRTLAATEPSVGFTRQVMARVHEDALTETVIAGDDRVSGGPVGRRPLVITLATTVMLATLIGMLLFDTPPPAEVEVVSADRAVMIRDGVTTELLATDQWSVDERRAGDRYVTRRDGALDLALWAGGLSVRLRAGEQTSLRLAAATETEATFVSLEDGELAVQTQVAMAIGMADGSRIELSRGDYAVSVDPVRHQDAREGVRVAVRVEHGVATLTRGDRTTAVTGGRIGRYTTFSTIYVDAAPDDDLFADSRRRGMRHGPQQPPTSSDVEPAFGEVRDPRTSTPVANATVTLTHFLGDESVQTDEAGRFRLTGLSELRGQFVLVRVVPPTRTAGLAPLPATPVFIDGRTETQPRPFFLRRAADLGGRIHDASGRSVPGLMLQPCRVDEVFGTVVPIGDPQPVKSGGVFLIRGLSTDASPHQSILLVASAPGRRPVVVWSGSAVRAGHAALDLALPETRNEFMGGFAPGAIVHLLQPVEGAPVRGVVAALAVRADATGQIALDTPRRLFVLDANGPPRVALRRADGRLEYLNTPAPHPLGSLRIGSVVPGRLHWFRTTAAIGVAHLPSGGGGFVSVQERSSGQACPGSSVFQRTPSGALRFLGVYDGRGALACADDTAGELLARTPEGWIGRFELGGVMARARKVVSVRKSARVRWEGPRDALVVLHRVTANGQLSPVVRHGSDGEWILHPGEYRFRGRHVTLYPATTTTLPR